MATTTLSEINPADLLPAMRNVVSQLSHALERCELHESRELVRTLQQLKKRVAIPQHTLAILSDSTGGKARLIQALLKTTLEDTSLPPSTVACTYIAHGTESEAAVTLTNSLTARLPVEQLAEFVNEKVPSSSIREVLARFPNAALKQGLTVIDTPVLQDPETLASCTATALADADACIFVLDARTVLEAGLPEKVLSFLRSVQGQLDKFFFVLGYASFLSEAEQEEVRTLASRSLQQQCHLSQPRVTLLASALPVQSEEGQSNEGQSNEESAPGVWTGSFETFQARLMEFASISSQRSSARQVVKVAGEALTQADRALNARRTLLSHRRLRKGVKVLEGIRTQAEALALAGDEAARDLEAAELAQSGEFFPLHQAPDRMDPVSEDDPSLLHRALRLNSSDQQVQAEFRPQAATFNFESDAKALEATAAAPLNAAILQPTTVDASTPDAGVFSDISGAAEIPESVKAWYAMPIGPPVKPAKRSSRRSGILSAAFGRSSSIEGAMLDDEEELMRNAGSPLWRLAVITAVAATAGAMFISIRPYLAQHGTPHLGAARSSAGHQTGSRSSITGLVAASTITAPFTPKAPENISVEQAIATTLEAAPALPGTLAAPGSTSVQNGILRPPANVPHKADSSRQQRLPGQLRGRRYTADGKPCDSRAAGSRQVSSSFAKTQHHGVSGFLRTVGSRLIHLGRRKDGTG